MTQPIEVQPPPEDFGRGSLLKRTTSLCPVCLSRIEAIVYARDTAVWMDKECDTHGAFSAQLSSDVAHYYQHDARLDSVGGCCGPGQHCGDQVANHSCNMLIEITQRCNLTCPTCYADSSPQRHETMERSRFEALVDQLLEQGKGDADLIQLSGGEPTLHPDLFEMISYALDRGVKQVYVNTNGIKLAKRAFAERVAAFGSRVAIYLQFDGLRPSTMDLLRGRADLVDTKLAALALCDELQIRTVPVVTLTRDVNDDELAQILDVALAHPRAVDKVMIQPAMYSGRYDNPRLVHRVTVADVAKLLQEQTAGLWREEDFGPIPCSDPNCFSMALALRTPDGLFPVSRYFPRYQSWSEPDNIEMIGSVSDTFDETSDLDAVLAWALSSDALQSLPEDEVDALLDKVGGWQAQRGSGEHDSRYQGLFAIGIKPFMDAYTYDQDRIDKCCVHIIASDGTPVSFCEYNAVNRPTGRG
ncbi:MAG: radical SAM protein [Myxococcales bacterium]|nr:radical SAM protein [Myxococcales bacterium]